MVYDQAKSSIFYNVWTTYWTFVSKHLNSWVKHYCTTQLWIVTCTDWDVTVAFQRKRVTCQNSSPKINVWPKKEETNVERWGTTSGKRWAWWEELGGGSEDGMGKGTNWTIWSRKNRISFFFPPLKPSMGACIVAGHGGLMSMGAWMYGVEFI